jgi:phosphoribosyl 1,2-cyclic phosphodiesterase
VYVEIHPFSIQHDAADPVAFTFRFNGIKFCICADLGFASTLVQTQLKNCDYLYIEANHQPEMLHACARPMVYKQRVLSRQGHLSNDACANLLSLIAHQNLKHIYLAHLSSECNSPDLALKIIKTMLDNCGMQIDVSIAHQDKVASPVLF